MPSCAPRARAWPRRSQPCCSFILPWRGQLAADRAFGHRPRRRLHRRRRDRRADRRGGQARRAAYVTLLILLACWRRSPGCCIGSNPGSRTTWRTGCWRRCASALFAKLDALAPAYLLRRRSGDLVALATQDVETVEYFYAHTVAPALVAVLVPATRAGDPRARLRLAAALALLPFLLYVGLAPLFLRRRIDRLGARRAKASAA